jgi:hypothetical protein
MSRVILRRLAGLTLGGFAAYLFVQRSTKRRRIESHRRARRGGLNQRETIFFRWVYPRGGSSFAR